MKETTNRRTVVAALLALAMAVACNGILGIEKAEVDPTFRVDSGALDGAAVESGAMDSAKVDSGSLCERYCNTIMVACVGEQKQYLSMATCLTMCPNFDIGDENAVGGNSLSCRITHANFARDKDPEVHCPHAGPLGAGTCGELCEGFCQQNVSLCKGPHAAYDGGDVPCKAACLGYPYLSGVGAGELTFTSGNSLNCRLWHLETASTPGFETTHCPHTGKVSATCVGPIDGGKN